MRRGSDGPGCSDVWVKAVVMRAGHMVVRVLGEVGRYAGPAAWWMRGSVGRWNSSRSVRSRLAGANRCASPRLRGIARWWTTG